jgi:hypothetical protein
MQSTARTVLRLLVVSFAVIPARAVAQSGGRNPAPPIPMVIKNICPGEGCELGDWLACQDLTARTAERSDASVAFRVKRSTHIRALTANLHVTRAGIIVFRDTLRITDDDILGNDTLLLTPADTLFPLFYGSEGGGNWFLHGKVTGGPWIVPDLHTGYRSQKGLVQTRRAETHWWVQVRNAQNREGWIDLGSTDYPPPVNIAGMFPHYEDLPLKC